EIAVAGYSARCDGAAVTRAMEDLGAAVRACIESELPVEGVPGFRPAVQTAPAALFATVGTIGICGLQEMAGVGVEIGMPGEGQTFEIRPAFRSPRLLARLTEARKQNSGQERDDGRHQHHFQQRE